jgi:hypothetical protein
MCFLPFLYPSDEPALPKAIHIRRALGGPLASAGLAVLFAVLSYATSMQTGVLWYMFTLMLLENTMILSLGAFLPLGFTDGSTLLSARKTRSRASLSEGESGLIFAS